MTRPGVCILAAPGPSLPTARLGEYGTLPDIIAVTSAFLAVPRAKIVYACDRRWWDVYRSQVEARHPGAELYGGRDARGEIPGVRSLVLDTKAPGLSMTPGLLHAGRNSGYQAINLAVLLGYTTLLLVGFDMREVGGKPHFFGKYPQQTLHRDTPYHELAPLFDTVRCVGFDIINCTAGSAITAFPMGRLGDFL